MPRFDVGPPQHRSANLGRNVGGRASLHDLAARLLRVLALLLCIALPASAWAQATAGRASSIVIPLAAKTGSFETEVWVRNANSASIDVDVLYYEANGLASPGLVACNFLTIAPNSNVSFKLGTQCPSLATGGHFGLLVLRDRAAQKVNTLAAYSRIQHVNTNQGFSVEGFPEHVFSGRAAGLVGLKRKAASVPATTAQPGYSTNCFVGSVGEAVQYEINVQEGFDSSISIGSTISGSLAPYQLVRYLDILGAAGAPAGDKDNVRVRFNVKAGTGNSPYLAFCTQQDDLTFGADFRIAKTDDEANITKLLTRCRGTDGADPTCATLTSPATFTIPDGGTKHRFSMFIHHPDFLRCDVMGPNAANLDMQLVAPNGTTVVAGGANQSSFYYETGSRQAVASTTGFQTFWNLDIGPREGASAPAFPAAYGLKCVSGSGIHVSGSSAPLTDDF